MDRKTRTHGDRDLHFFLRLAHLEDAVGIVMLLRHQDDRLVHMLRKPFEKRLRHERQLHAPQHPPRKLKKGGPGEVLLCHPILHEETFLFEGLEYAEGRAFDDGESARYVAHAERFNRLRDQPQYLDSLS